MQCDMNDIKFLSYQGMCIFIVLCLKDAVEE